MQKSAFLHGFGCHNASLALRDHVLELAVVERGIEPAAREQLAVRALLDDIAVAHDEDAVGIADGAQAVRDDKARAAAHEVVHRLLNELLGAGVDRAGRLVEDEDGSVGEHGARDGQQLLLPLGDVRRLLVELHLVTAGRRADEGVGARGLRRRDDLGVGRVGAAVADVFHDRALEEPRVLQHHAEGTPQITARIVAHVAPVDEDGAGVHIVKAHEQLDHGGLAGAGRADDGDSPARRHVAAPVVDDRLREIVAEAHVAERHVAADVVRRSGQRGVGRLLRLLEEGKHALAAAMVCSWVLICASCVIGCVKLDM